MPQYRVSAVSPAGDKTSWTWTNLMDVEICKALLRASDHYTEVEVWEFSGEGRCKRLAA